MTQATTGKNEQAPAGMPVLKTVKQAAAYVGMSERTIRRYIRSGKLNTIEIGGGIRIQPADLDQLASEAAGTTGKVAATTGENDRHAPGTMPDPLADALRDTIARQGEEITYLRGELTAIRLMLPAPSEQSKNNRPEIGTWAWILLALAVLAACASGYYWLFVAR